MSPIQQLSLLKLLIRISKLNILILYPLQGEVDSLLYSLLGNDFKNLKQEDLELRVNECLHDLHWMI